MISTGREFTNFTIHIGTLSCTKKYEKYRNLNITKGFNDVTKIRILINVSEYYNTGLYHGTERDSFELCNKPCVSFIEFLHSLNDRHFLKASGYIEIKTYCAMSIIKIKAALSQSHSIYVS